MPEPAWRDVLAERARGLAQKFNPYHEPAGSPIGGQFASAEAGTSPAGPQHFVGITSATGSHRDPKQIAAEMNSFVQTLEDAGIAGVHAHLGTGAWLNPATGQVEAEPTWVLRYRGNGKALRWLGNAARAHDQEAVLLMTRVAPETPGSVRRFQWDFGQPLSADNLHSVAQIATNSGITSWTYDARTGRMSSVFVEQWDNGLGSEAMHIAHAAIFSRQLARAGFPEVKTSVASVRVTVLEKAHGYQATPDLPGFDPELAFPGGSGLAGLAPKHAAGASGDRGNGSGAGLTNWLGRVLDRGLFARLRSLKREQPPSYVADGPVATQKQDAAHAGFFVALQLDPWAAQRLALPDGEAAGTLHVTLSYCPEWDPAAADAAIAALEEVADAYATLSGRIGGVGRFAASASSDGQEVVYAVPDVPGLAGLRQAVVEALAIAGIMQTSEHGWSPHVTLAYVSETDRGMPTVPVIPVTVDLAQRFLRGGGGHRDGCTGCSVFPGHPGQSALTCSGSRT
jgi:2'-5' RNA ligase